MKKPAMGSGKAETMAGQWEFRFPKEDVVSLRV
jgi:hypothetical protein